MTDAALETVGLVKRYGRGRSPVLADVTVSIPRNSSVALVGPNGAGKTTLLRCFMGFERPTVGRVLVLGLDPNRERAAALAAIGYVGQRPGLYAGLTVDEHLSLAAALRRGFDVPAARLRLRRVGVPLGARVATLSGGQQAQVAVGLALATGAPVLLLDEPLASLDPLARRELLETVSEANRTEGTTVLIASHIIGELDSVCDRLIVLGNSRVMVDDEIDELRTLVPREPQPNSDDAETARPASAPERPSLEEIVLRYLAESRTNPRDPLA